MRAGSVGGIRDLGVVPGRWAGADPTGRYVTMLDGDTVSTYGAGDLAPVASHVVGRARLIATHPAGGAVGVLGADWSLEVWSAGRRVASRGTGLAGSSAVATPPDAMRSAAWLTFTADGAYLLAGLAAPDGGPVRLDLLDATTLDLIDTTDVLPGGYPDYDTSVPPADWGEGVMLVTASSPAGTVAFAANVGDDPHVLALVEVIGGRLHTYTTAAGTAFAAQVPGERIDGIALDAAATLYVMDSDDVLTAFTWRDPDRPPRRVTSGHLWFTDSAATHIAGWAADDSPTQDTLTTLLRDVPAGTPAVALADPAPTDRSRSQTRCPEGR